MAIENLLVSVVTPMFNAASVIDDCYDGLVSQRFENWEWIVVDDCSTDDSSDRILRLCERDRRVKLVCSEHNVGPGLARNLGLKISRGKYIAFLDIDDAWLPDKLRTQINLMVSEKSRFSFTAYWICDAQLRRQKPVDTQTTNSVTYKDLLKKKVTMLCSSVVIDRSLIGDGMLGLRSGQDFAFWLAILKKGQVANKIPEPLTLYRTGLTSVSSNKLKKALRQWQILRDVEKLSFFTAVICFFYYARNATFRK